MEVHQRDLIVKNLPDLLRVTNCSSLFLRQLRLKNILSHEEVDILGSKMTRNDKADFVYNVLLTRVGGFEALTEALEATCQSGALMILQSKKKKEELDSQIESSPADVLNLEITYNGKHIILRKLLPFLTVADAHKVLVEPECREELHYINKPKQKTFTIVLEHLAYNPVYIPRQVSNYISLNPKIFMVDSQDIFVFEGIGFNQLCDLVKPNTVETSRFIEEQSKSRHILLDRPKDWDNLVTRTSNPVHLIKANIQAMEFVLMNTTSITKVIWDHTHKRNSVTDAFVSENEIINKLTSESETCAVCVCDLPGAGKTWLLERLAWEVKVASDTNKLVAFVRLSHFSQYLQDHEIFKTKSQPSLTDLLPIFFYFVCGSKLAASIVKCGVLEKKLAMCLLLDGLDEMSPDHIGLIIPLLDYLFKHKISLCVTSRPHLRKQLEDVSFISYDLFPLSKEEQSEYFAQTWRQNQPMIDHKKLDHFAKCLISAIYNQVEKGNQVETPLQIYVLARIYKSMALEYATAEIPKLPTFDLQFTSRTLLMKRFVKESTSNLINKSGADSKRIEQLNNFHTEKALTLVFSRLAYQLKDVLASSENISMEDANLTGIYTTGSNSSNEIVFTHRIFAEYFAAKFFYDFWTGSLDASFSHHADVIVNYFFPIVLGSVPHYSEDLFQINSSWEEIEFETRVFRNDSVIGFIEEMFASQNASIVVPEIFCSFVDDGLFFNAIFCSIAKDYKSVLKICQAVMAVCKVANRKQALLAPKANFMIYKSEDFDVLEQWMSEYRQIASIYFLLHWTAKHGSRNMLQSILNLIEIVDRGHISETLRSVPVDMVSPIVTAIKRNMLDIVALLIEKLETVSPVMIETCLVETYPMNDSDREKRRNILKLLVDTDPKILNNFPTRDSDIGGVSLILIQTMTTDYNFDWKQVGSGDKLRLLQNTLMIYTDLEFKTIFELFYDKSSELLLQGISLIQAIAFGRLQDVDTFQLILLHGGDLKETGCNGETLLHLACSSGKTKLASYLVEIGLSVHTNDNFGRTPLHYLSHINPIEITRCMIDKGADIMAVDMQKDNILHKLAQHQGISLKLIQDWIMAFPDMADELFKMRNKSLSTPRDILTIKFGDEVIGLERDLQSLKLCSKNKSQTFADNRKVRHQSEESLDICMEEMEANTLTENTPHGATLNDTIVQLFAPEEIVFDTTTAILKKRGEVKLSETISSCKGNRNLKQRGSTLYNTKLVLGKSLRHSVNYLGTYNQRIPVCVKQFYCTKEWQETLIRRISEIQRNLTNHQFFPECFSAEIIKESYLLVVSELCSCSLQDNIRKKYFSYNDLDVVKQLVVGLEYLHNNNITHGNMKPTNVLFSFCNGSAQSRTIKIADGGMSTLLDTFDNCISAATDLNGIVFWVGREILLHIDDKNTHTQLHTKLEKSDIFSLGCLIYYILTSGNHPFGLGPQCGLNILNGEYKIDSIQGSYPNALDLVKSMISSEKDKRPTCLNILHHDFIKRCGEIRDSDSLFIADEDIDEAIDLSLG